MNGNEIKRIVDAIHRDKMIDKEIVFEGIELATRLIRHKHGAQWQQELDQGMQHAQSQRARTRSVQVHDRADLEMYNRVARRPFQPSHDKKYV